MIEGIKQKYFFDRDLLKPLTIVVIGGYCLVKVLEYLNDQFDQD